MLLFIIFLLLAGLVVGALGRVIHPGRDDMSLGVTLLIGIAAMLIAGLVVRPLIGFGGGFVTAVIVAVVLVAVYARMAANGSSGRVSS